MFFYLLNYKGKEVLLFVYEKIAKNKTNKKQTKNKQKKQTKTNKKNWRSACKSAGNMFIVFLTTIIGRMLLKVGI
jgi:glucokinase